jgi:hypothetical protein
MGPLGTIPGGGDIVTETLNPWQFYPCPYADSSKPLPWVILSDVRSIEEVNDIYGSEVKAEEVAQTSAVLDRLLTNVIEDRTSTIGSGSGVPKRKDACILKRLYSAPNKSYPKGRLFAWVGKDLLQEGDLPEGDLTFTPIDWFPIPGRAYPLPFVTPLRPLQREVNIALSQLIELKNRQLRGDMAIRGNAIPTEDYQAVTTTTDKESGAKYFYMDPSVQDFEVLRYDLNVGEAEKLLAWLWNEEMQESGVHETSLGSLQGAAAVTATHVMMLKESDQAGLTLFRAGFDSAYCKVARHKLLLAKNHYHLPRMIRIVGDRNQVKASAFFGADLRNTEDVRPRSIPMLTQSMTQQLRSEAAQAGLYGPYMGPADMLAKTTALLNSGIPNIHEEIEKLIAPFSLEDLQRIVAEINMAQAQTAYTAALMQAQGVAMESQQMMQQAQAQGQEQPGLAGPPGQTL